MVLCLLVGLAGGCGSSGDGNGNPGSGGTSGSATGGSFGTGGGGGSATTGTGGTGGTATTGTGGGTGGHSSGGGAGQHATGGGAGGHSMAGAGGQPAAGGNGGHPTAGAGGEHSGGAGAAGHAAVGGAGGHAAGGSPGVFTAANGKVYDPTGQPFLLWGVNKVHSDQANNGLELMNPNAVRVDLNFRLPNATTTTLMNRFVQNHLVIIPGRWDATCKEDSTFTTALTGEVDAWVQEAETWKTYERAAIFNIANEAGPSNSTVWRDAYITAVQRMRSAGYAGLLMIDSGGCGQDVKDIVNYGAAVLAADPLHNLVFSLHVYGNAQTRAALDTMLDQIQATGLSALVGEFGPGRNIGPSPTAIAPQDVMASALAHGFGALAWAADDNDLPNSMADDNWFSLLYDIGSPYTGQAAQLTMFGKVVINDPTVGLIAIAKKAGGL